MTSQALMGLTREEVELSRAQHGSNRLAEIRGRSWWSFVKEGLDDKTLKILIGAAAVVFVIDLVWRGQYVDGFAILVAVAVAAGVRAYNDRRAQAEFKSLQMEREARRVRVIRGGKVEAISSYDLVAGDVVEIEAGDKVPADGRLATSYDLLVNESMLTGEANAVSKDSQGDAQLWAGTLLVEGRGTLVITAVGDKTEYGRLRAQLAVEQAPTPLQERLGKLADRIGLFALAAAILIFLALSGAGLVQGKLGFDIAALRQMLEFLVVGVTIVVVAVPEGLPVAVTISLAYSVMKMAREKTLVRRLMGCETMGAADVLCVDKTGTLTQNEMRVEHLRVAGVTGDDLLDTESLPAPLRTLFAEIAAVNSTAHIERTGATLAAIGNPTETALLMLLDRWGIDYRALRQEARVEKTFTFTSARKSMSTLVRTGEDLRLLCKGAPEVILSSCTKILGRDGPQPLSQADRSALTQTLDTWAQAAKRTLALAYRDIPANRLPEALEEDLVLVGIVGIGDPLRADVPDAIAACRAAGVEVKVVTGDSLLTGAAAAQKLGLLEAGDLAMDGAEFRAHGDQGIQALLPRLKLLARAVPSDKLRLVRLLKDQGHTVAVTGDGTNDGPALRHADVGLAMGRSGTDVAREASDIVILDDSLTSVVKALRWGRAIFANIQKFIQFQLTVSLVALATAFIAGVTGFGTPLNVVQLLWVNLIMDTLAALALSLDPPSEALMSQPPHGRTAPLITRTMWAHIGGLGGLMLAVLLIALYSDLFVPTTHPAHLTFVFNTFVCLQIANLINCRTTRLGESPLRGLLRARLFLGILLLIVAVQVAIVQLGGQFFRTVPLSGQQWLISILLGAGVIGAGALLRFLGRTLLPRWGHVPVLLARRTVEVWRRFSPWLGAPASQGPLGLVAVGGGFGMLAGMALRGYGRAPAFGLFAAGLAAASVWAWERRQSVFARATGLSVRRHAAISVALALLLVVFANVLAARHYRRFDLTAARKFELSTQTLRVLDRLDHPARFTTLFRPGSLTTEVKDLLAEYSARTPLVQVWHIDPDRDPGEVERLVDRLKLKRPELSSIIVEYQGRSRVISGRELLVRKYEYRGGRRYLSRAAPEFRGEEALSSGLVAIMTDTPAKICVVTGHGERSPDDFGPRGLAMARDRLRREGFIVETVHLFYGLPAPASCQVVLQAGPERELSPRAKEALSAYLAQGGKWLLLVEPWQTGGLDTLLGEWGLEIRPLYLTDAKLVAAGMGPTTLVAANYQDHPITLPLVGTPTFFPYATSVRRIAGRRSLEGANLILTTNAGIGETDRNSVVPRYDEGQDRKGELSVAAAVDEPPNLYGADGRREPARIVAIGDTDFATNAHLHRGANADLFVNAIDWLARREELIAVRSRPPELRRVVLSASDQSAIYWLSLGVLPASVGLLGAAVAWRRRS